MERVDVVYTLAPFSKHGDDWELRYSLRSLAQQDWVGEIYMVGHCPSWATDVWFVPCGDPWPAVKDANIIYKVLTACQVSELSSQFVINSDDHYILKPIPLEGLGPWLENPSQLPESYRKMKRSTWHRRLVETMNWCRKIRRPEWVTECHIPYLVSKKLYQEKMGPAPYARGNGLWSHFYYCAVLDLKDAPKLEPLGMTVRLKDAVTRPELDKLTRKAVFFNHNNKGLSPAVKTWMEERFPDPSPWEVSEVGKRVRRVRNRSTQEQVSRV